MEFKINLSEKEFTLIEEYAQNKNISISDLFRTIVLEKIEDEMDLECYEKAMTEHRKKDTSISFDDFIKNI